MEAQLLGRRYLIQSRIGQGGMGEVFRTYDRLTQKTVALKRVTVGEQLDFSSASGKTDYRVALAQEFKILASIRHPNIISVLDFGFDLEGQPYFTMQLLEEATTLLEAGKGRSFADKINLLIQMLQALAYLHQRGVIHRDLKPGNVLVEENTVKMLDFGLALAREQLDVDADSTTAGTLQYMAPEVLKGLGASEASDLYAVGVLAYQLFTGHHPFGNRTLQELVLAVINEEPNLTALNNISTKPHHHLDPNNLPDFSDLDTAATQELSRIFNKAEVTTDDHSTTFLDKAFDEVNNGDSSQIKSANTPLVEEKPTLVGIMQRLLTKNPEHRYQSARQVMIDFCTATGSPLPPETAEIRESYLQTAKFVGRATELTLLHNALKKAVAGEGSTWLVAGESGVGKSRLLDELQIQALVDGAMVLRGQAVTEIGTPYELWHDILSHLCLDTEIDDFTASVLKAVLPEIETLLFQEIENAPVIEPQAAQSRLLIAIEEVFKQQQHPLVIILEDLQWAGDSLSVLQSLTRIVEGMPFLIVGSYRDNEYPTLPDEIPNSHLIKLPRLDAIAIEKISTYLLGDEAGHQQEIIDFLTRETEGNVFFIMEIVRSLAEEAGRLDQIAQVDFKQMSTHGMQAIIERRLQRVPPVYRPTLELAAIAGRLLDLDILRHDLRSMKLEDWLTNCANAGVLDVYENRWRFAHDKLREGILSKLNDDQRLFLHRRVAEAMEMVYRHQIAPYYGVLAFHWGEAHEFVKEANYAALAGERAYINGANTDAIHFLERALDLEAYADFKPFKIAQMLWMLGESHFGSGHYDICRGYMERSFQLLGYSRPHSTSAMLRGIIKEVFKQFRYRRTHFQGLQDNEELANQYILAARIAERLAHIYFVGNQKVPTLYHTTQGLNHADQAGIFGRAEQASFYSNMVVVGGAIPAHRISRYYLKLSDQAGEDLENLRAQAWRLEVTGIYFAGLGMWADAERRFIAAMNYARQSGNWRRYAEILLVHAFNYYHMGKWDEALANNKEARNDILRQQNHSLEVIYNALEAQFCLHKGDFATALALTLRGESMEQLGHRSAATILYGMLAETQMHLGNPEKARHYADHTLGIIEPVAPTTFYSLIGYTGMMNTYLALYQQAPSDDLLKHIERAFKKFKAFGKIFVIGKPAYHHYLQRWYLVQKKTAKSQKAGQESLQHAQHYQMPLEEALAHYYLAESYAEGTAERQTHRQSAEAILRRLEATHLLATLFKSV